MNSQTLILTWNMILKGYTVQEIGQHLGNETAVACVTYLLLGNPWEQLAIFCKLSR